jgi:hypothetical protein
VWGIASNPERRTRLAPSLCTVRLRSPGSGPAVALFAAAAVLALAGCGGSSAHSTAPPPTTASSSSSPTASAAPSATAVPGTLTDAQVQAALPTLASLPAGWVTDTDATLTMSFTAPTTDPVKPKLCTKPSQVQQNFNFAGTAVASGHADYIGGAKGPEDGVMIYSFKGVYPAAYFASIRSAVHLCPSYIESDGTAKVHDTVALVKVPHLGEEALALSIRGVGTGGEGGLILIELVRSGHTLISVAEVTSGTPVDRTRVESLASGTLHRIA